MKRMATSITLERQEIIDLLDRWWITMAVMASLLMQLLLLMTGGMRKWNLACRFVAWNAYNWSDYVATAALGGLAQSAAGRAQKKKEVYAIWAPILLLHLGAPDNISAYATADAELWQRHGLTMLLQIASVMYVVANCARGWKYVLLSICLSALGSIKYAERTLALKHASRADVIQSALPIYKYMLAEATLQLDIKGAGDHGLKSPVSFSQSLPASRNPQPNPSYYYIIRGEKQWLRNFLRGGETNYIHNFSDAAKATPELVTLQDVLSSQQLNQIPSVVFLCVGFALFKLYKRRLSNLHMYEWREDKTRELFMQKHVFEKVEEIVFVLDVELRFLFDSLYTKASGTAFSKLGIGFRVLTTILLVVSGVFIFRGTLNLHDQDIEQARNVTFCLIAAALVIEAYQLVRLALSDWTKVSLVCSYIGVSEQLKNKSRWSIRRCLRGLWLAALARMIRIFSSIGRHKYWRGTIGQYAMVQYMDNQSMWRWINGKLARLMSRNQLQLLPEYEHSKQAVDEFRSYVFAQVLAACGSIGRNYQTLDPMWFLPKYNEDGHRRILLAAVGANDQVGNRFYMDLEHLIISWHVATCVCELLAAPPPASLAVLAAASMEVASPNVNSVLDQPTLTSPVHQLVANTDDSMAKDFRMSKLLSRYLMYLLVHKTELLPCHADIARTVAAETERDIRALTWNVESIRPVLISMEPDNIECTPGVQNPVSFNLTSGMKAASLLQALPSDVRWRLIVHVWVDILVCAASANKPIEQLAQLTLGGEFLTHLWVLLGHMGCGAQ
eukprot:c20337_g1_i1 orf=168-2522(+)